MKRTTSLPREVVQPQLDRIIASRQFCNAPRLSRFLSYVVEESLAERLDRLKGYTIGLEVFDKPEDFDPQTDTIVRVQARALRQKLDQYYAQDGAQDPVRISVAKGSYEPAFYLFGGGDRHTDGDAIVPAAPSTKPSIAVLPFDDFSQDQDCDFFSDGLTAEVIANLSQFKELSVFSRSTTKKAKLDGLSVPQIYAAFRPDFVLEGSYRISDQAVVLTINLVVASTDEVILTQHFSRDMTPNAIYAVQDEMALMIAERIADRFGPLDQYACRAVRAGQSVKWDTYRWISRYHQYAIQLSDTDRLDIKAGLTKAIETDRTSSDAYAALALITLDEYRMSFRSDNTGDLLEQALSRAEQAVRCDPENATALEAMAVVRFHRREFGLFKSASEQALALNPGHPDMLAMIGICHAAQMNWDRAMPLLDRAIALNPLQPGWYHVPKAIGLAMTGHTKDAVAEMRISPLPGVFFYHCHMIWMLAETGDMAAALQEKAHLLTALADFENVILGHCRAWCLDDAILGRAVVGWQSVGLNVRDGY